MALWLMFVLMTAAAILAVLWPLSRRTPVHRGNDVAVYRDQLDEIERDRAAGLIADKEAEAARVEVSRRLLAAAEAAEATLETVVDSPWRRRAAAVVGLVLVPLIAASLYLKLGSPYLPGEPLALRAPGSQDNRSIAGLISQVESHLDRNPNDGRGWEVLAPVYLRIGRFDDAIKARKKAIDLNGETADRRADLGEAIVAAANGVVTADAKTAFERALVLDAQHLKSRFFIGLAAQQDGQRDKAGEIWRGMLNEAPPDAPWLQTVQRALAELQTSGQPGPNAQDVAAASQMTEAQRGDMVRGMVANLAARLAQDGSDVDGWLRLLRAYMVLGEREKAQAAAVDARRALANDPDKLKRVDEAIKGLGLS
ncbi:MAG: c-type cytochrome biogenesis protein CcmI [Pseudolabrys sp.]|nr:c-type cytochrome biogenesis protein CcmI [Pseudolabrys sp.]MBV9261629.1 c-type cytochrome biogenesis protein CcmI [Pseudolabrys sp.]